MGNEKNNNKQQSKKIKFLKKLHTSSLQGRKIVKNQQGEAKHKYLQQCCLKQ